MKIVNSKYTQNGVWMGPTGPNLHKNNPAAYLALHRYLRKQQPKPQDGLCENCRERPFTEIACTDEQYSKEISTYEWQCTKCNMQHPLTKAKISATTIGKLKSPEIKAKISATKFGKKRVPFSIEHRAKMSAARTAYWNNKPNRP